MITFFHRNHKCGYSIYKVFSTIESELKGQGEDVNDFFMPSSNSMPWDVVKNSIFTFKHRNKKGINHISGHIHDVILGLIGCKTVLTIHDLVFIDNVKNPLKKFYKWLFWLYIPVKLADKVTCISNETKRNILTHIKTDKVTVIYNPIDPSFKYNYKEFNEKSPIILHIGTFWNKNLERSILALEGIKCHLRIVGKIDDKITQLLKDKKIEYSNIMNLSDDEIKYEYINCDIVNFPSIYEGFGMPVIEGQKTGRIVISSNIEPIKEIAGEGAYLIDPFSVEDMRNAYLEVIKNKGLRTTLIKKGLQNVERFEVRKIAQQYIEVYNSIEK